jgi:hypothetical protein
MQREPSSRDSRGGRSQTWPRAASWRAVVWWCGHWSSKLWRRVANDMLKVGFILVFFASGGFRDLVWVVVSSSNTRTELLLL